MPKHSRAYWIDFTLSFLYITELACNEIIRDENKRAKELNIALIYNLRHATEILLKTLIRFSEGGSKTDVKCHDIDELFDRLIEIIQRLRKRNNKPNFKNASAEIKKEIEKFPKTANGIKEIIDYYNQLRFLSKRDLTIYDTKNTAFKYPEHQIELNAKVDYARIIDSKLNAKKIKNDIKKLRDYLDSALTVFQYFNFGN